MPEPKAQRTFRINHTYVGPWSYGRIVTEGDIRKRGSKVEELLAIKVGDTPAIVEVSEPPTQEPPPLGPLNETTPPPAPATETKQAPPPASETPPPATDNPEGDQGGTSGETPNAATRAVDTDRKTGTGTRVIPHK